MNKAEYKKKQDKEAIDFFRKFIKLLTGGRAKLIHFGWWRVGGGKFGLSMYWDSDEE